MKLTQRTSKPDESRFRSDQSQVPYGLTLALIF